MRATVTFTCEHTEEDRTPFDEAVAGFLLAMDARGYRGVAEVVWDGSPLTTGLNGSNTRELGRVLRDDNPGGDYRLEPIPMEPATITTAEIAPSRSFVSKGGGYYEILENGVVVDTVRGKAAAEAAIS